MSEGNDVLSRPKQLISQALKKVRGENTLQLVEDFTSEMTLVAEGLCEDQSVLHNGMDTMRRDLEQYRQSLKSDLSVMDTTITENQKEIDRRLTEMSRRLDALEKVVKPGKHTPRFWANASFMQQLTLLAGIVMGSWVLVTVLNLFR